MSVCHRMADMMGQELFEHPLRQYAEYGVTELREESPRLGDPASFEDDTATEEQLDLMEEVFARHAEDAVTFDEESGLWIVGPEEGIERMFADREAFLDALEAGEDPGV